MDFKVKCVRYIKDSGKYFTVGKVYDVVNGVLTSDRGFKYDSWSNPYWEGRGNNFESLQKWFDGHWEFELVGEKKVFTKSDLKNGDIVVRRNGSVEVVILDLDVLITKEGWNNLSDINEDLTDTDSWDIGDEWNIIKVYRPTSNWHCQLTGDSHTHGTLVYDRERDTKPKKPLYNGKVVCVKNSYVNKDCYTIGKIYQFNDGVLICDSGDKITKWHNEPFYSFDEFVKFSSSEFIEIKE